MSVYFTDKIYHSFTKFAKTAKKDGTRVLSELRIMLEILTT